MGVFSDLPETGRSTEKLAAGEAVLQRFEAAWRHGPPPAIDNYLTGDGSARRALLLELVHLDLEFRLKAGEPVRVESYLSRYPDLAADQASVRGLIVAEYRLRRRCEGDLNIHEYLTRFPEFGDDLEESLHRGQDSTRLDHAAPLTDAAGAPADLPDFRVLGELGKGGMGVVYKAVQLSLHRTVALKMIRAGAHAGPELLARFHLEAEALASLQHPNIVQIYEIGQHGGCPFMAMEFVEGGSLADHLGGRPQPPRAAAEFVQTLARAMHCAHLRGIVHRDLKPGNILLQGAAGGARSEGRGAREGGLTRDEGRGTREVSSLASPPSPLAPRPSLLAPKITDFGLAKRLEAGEGQTATGVIVGTPSYMAPEQAEGKSHSVGPLADVYALGAILYEMLTGRPPFVGETHLETIHRVLADEPTTPTLLQRAVPRDLATICLKCLEKDPARRYASAEALADDLGRFLGGEPIVARPAHLPERAAKWLKRHPALAALIGVSSAAALALLVGGWVSYEQVLNAYLETSKERDRSAENARVAFDAVDHLYTRMAEERLLDEPSKDPLREELLARAPALYQRLAEQQNTDPSVRREIGLAWFRLGDIHRILNQTTRAEAEFLQAIERQEALCREYPARADYLRELAESHIWLGELLREDHQRLPEAEVHFGRALGHQERALQLLSGEGAEQRKCLLGLARSYYNLGIVTMDTGRPHQSRADYDHAVAILTDLHRVLPDDVNCRQDLARALINRGILHKENNRPADARRDYDQAREHMTALSRRPPNRATYKYELAIVCQNLGNLLASTNVMEARAAENEALGLLKELTEDFSTRPRYKKKLANALISQGILAAQTGDRAGAKKYWDQARDLLQRLGKEGVSSGDYEALLGIALGNLGWLETENKSWAEARQLLEAALVHLNAGLTPGLKRKDYEQALRQNTQTLTETLLQLGYHAAAFQSAEALANLHPQEPRNSYYAACFIARCIPLAQKDSRREVARIYADRAVGALRQTPGRITNGLERLPNEKQLLQPLEGYPGFAEAMAALDAKTK
jgi:serine/threonine protein kinase